MVTEKREIRGKYLITFLLTLSIFIIGILVGMLASNYKVSKIESSQREIMTGVAMRDAYHKLIETDTCLFDKENFANEELFKVADRLTALERDLGTKDSEVVSLKKYYTALQVEEYLYLLRVKRQCKSENVLNLFFYSNDELKCANCLNQGFILTYVREKDPRLRTYSFDVDLGSPLIEVLMKRYNITTVPSMVLNNKSYSGFRDKNELLEILNNARL